MVLVVGIIKHFFFLFLVMFLENCFDVVQKAVAVTTAIQEAIFLEMGVGESFCLLMYWTTGQLGKNSVYAIIDVLAT